MTAADAATETVAEPDVRVLRGAPTAAELQAVRLAVGVLLSRVAADGQPAAGRRPGHRGPQSWAPGPLVRPPVRTAVSAPAPRRSAFGSPTADSRKDPT